MSHLHVKYLLAGGGIASSSAAVAIRKMDPVSPLLIIGQEANRPYQRAPLSKGYLRKTTSHSDLFTLPDGWFSANNVELRTGRRVAHLDTARCAVTLDNGKEISYDHLLLATGASATRLDVPGAQLPSLYYIRTLDDVERLIHAIDQAKTQGLPHANGPASGRGNVAIIGGGILGVELAGTLSTMGLAVHLIVGPAHPWHRFAGEPAGRYLTRYLQNHGIEVSNACRASALEGDGRVQRMKLDDGRTINCDFAIATVGSSANRELLRNTPLTAEKAILVNDHCQTLDERIYAAGDCAAVFDPLFGKHRIIDHWQHAVATGTIAGTNMAGGEAAYNIVNRFDTKVLDLTATVFGEARLVDRRIVRGSTAGDNANFAEIGIAADGRIAQILAIGTNHDFEGLQQLVAKRVAVNGNQERLKDADVSLAEFV
jgi:3-phenylpropionate/trans-cinnamate dioxygenase ferredoxin reductase subunit